MNRIIGISLLGILSLSSTQVLAQELGKKMPDRQVCRNYPVTSSIVPKRVCLTRAQWLAVKQLRQDNRSSLFAYTPIQIERGL